MKSRINDINREEQILRRHLPGEPNIVLDNLIMDLRVGKSRALHATIDQELAANNLAQENQSLSDWIAVSIYICSVLRDEMHHNLGDSSLSVMERVYAAWVKITAILDTLSPEALNKSERDELSHSIKQIEDIIALNPMEKLCEFNSHWAEVPKQILIYKEKFNLSAQEQKNISDLRSVSTFKVPPISSSLSDLDSKPSYRPPSPT